MHTIFRMILGRVFAESWIVWVKVLPRSCHNLCLVSAVHYTQTRKLRKTWRKWSSQSNSSRSKHRIVYFLRGSDRKFPIRLISVIEEIASPNSKTKVGLSNGYVVISDNTGLYDGDLELWYGARNFKNLARVVCFARWYYSTKFSVQ